jgi:hypothetical protein
MNTKEQTDLVRLTSAGNPVLAHIWQQALEERGIRCQVLGDYLSAGLGDIPGIMAEIWIDPKDVARAEAILREYQSEPEPVTNSKE